MALLTETLEQILKVLENSDNPFVVHIAESLQPGLTDEAIAAKLVDFPYTLPDEVIELYKWRNGQVQYRSAGLADIYTFLSLEDALKEYKRLIELAMETEREVGVAWQGEYDPRWFPIFRESANYYIVPTLLKPQQSAPILSKSEYLSGEEVRQAKIYPSLTSMMLEVATNWETDVYYTC
ncbi:PBS lyase HEAT-like repeat protein [Leptolyngbya sp. NIES-3755]|nr:PBS lyase HEAT-like repeat protein [Leptolyngbya sp. NIES-3755]